MFNKILAFTIVTFLVSLIVGGINDWKEPYLLYLSVSISIVLISGLATWILDRV